MLNVENISRFCLNCYFLNIADVIADFTEVALLFHICPELYIYANLPGRC